jgi:hypothetical protein
MPAALSARVPVPFGMSKWRVYWNKIKYLR